MSETSKILMGKAQEQEAEDFLTQIATVGEQDQLALLAFIRGVQIGRTIAIEQKGA